MENKDKKEENLSPQGFMQLVAVLKVDRYMAENGDRESVEEAKKFEKRLREQAKLLGGKEKINSWLQVNDPYHMRPDSEQFKDFDWGFLKE